MGLTQNLGLLSTAIKATSTLNVGIGTSSPNQALDIYRASGGAYVGLTNNTSAFLIGVDSAGLSRIFTGDARPISFWTNGTEKARLLDNGNLLIGSTTDVESRFKLQVSEGDIYAQKATGNPALFLRKVSTTTNFEISCQETRTRIRTWSTANDRDIFFDTDNAGTTRMIITGGGLIGMGTSPGSGRLNVLANPANNILVEWQNSAGVTVGTVTVVGAGTQTAYNTSSDYRLKEDLQEIKGLEKLSSIKVYDFKWKGTEERMDGVLAHELAQVLPYAVSGEKDDEMMQGVDYSKLVPVLVKAIQELKAEIDQLKAK